MPAKKYAIVIVKVVAKTSGVYCPTSVEHFSVNMEI